ncbi:extracellular solute-binding protein [Bifidobacterium eulemuris]|uniref:ABC transporter substrate-binding protein n=1 Tax=Bifidobacterium eulemuris TaxID=1765219 RepID=A0A261G3F4_9BIFI|nr:extracellular solute-binding protein [Bifidobacterium eulemuris]OZG65950.1 ABC transporter substrate-binding protein [Bifidobacterium eulemuris]QOL32014.1 extracellular solute-binding protein [Bifidobacterium eulemuris]
MSVQLKGITWGHSRGFTSIVGVTQRYAELHPGFDITWHKRSLTEFESKPIDQLAAEYDLLIIDHPWAGFAAAHNVLLPLDEWLDADYMADQRANSVGQSCASYDFDGFQSALAIDAASPVAVWRPDRLSADAVPSTFDEVLELAKQGVVAFAGTPQYLLMDFIGLCNTAGGRLFAPGEEHVVDRATGVRVLEDMRRLARLCDPAVFEWSTIELHERLAKSDTLSYCPWVYGYVNYSRRGYAEHALKAGNVPAYAGRLVTGVLGGTGLAISAGTRHPREAADFVAYAASGEVQRTLFADNGGQPGHRAAWLDEECNRTTLDFFADTLETLDASYMRPRYSGYLTFQDNAGGFIQDFVRGDGAAEAVLDQLDALYVRSREQ